MGVPIYPVVHVAVDNNFPEAFEQNLVRLTLTTCVPHELLVNVGQSNLVVEELMGKAKELIRSDRKELTSG
ncbi:hypothetical protein [Mycobacterium intracellulare]|uniref:Uncharacterized protein n=1 Tax=Mycobacterium intracellulare TaxID=1767 RepID=A0AAE4U224_MYCIT|nr:hypothetical protein [Mycobacterium intracellulare]MDV6975277.1 hypothetical protein [Mycobacterium intracellulare]MDV6980341.1 hypothetical protein [Mycobacterium intracellulare]MDV7010770.1 hypothetical protein [Mycobacterium intracellulare]MDV7025676.1 hypothetical protein [Mycobacterium intracellulare]